MESYRQDAGYPVLGIVTETVPNPVLLGVAVWYVSVCERSLQWPKKTHSSRNAQLQFVRNRKYAKNARFLNTTTSDLQHLPTFSAFRTHKVLYLLTEIRLQIYRYIETRCLATRLYAFEGNSEIHRYLRWFLHLWLVYTYVKTSIRWYEACKCRSLGGGDHIYIYIYIYVSQKYTSLWQLDKVRQRGSSGW